ncbi:MAG: NAD(P)H-hydrate epimerase [Candidatus Omnitrophica bacterium CG11_big_fil_rev_8_21_14_0_20_42_13]|uniref:NAD(P)H-hydrate epimerase n=1 Tax=Candidatus Ghiorseimicrobium undicola TaxID=1974746 RepID=A0A2H0LX71_9BACT|nr:MAG: NAD(P)H-hydrate epimerase [Candidatus Omnitrophica bacterium CG11_big_fil_rev_8_21_14_0_20_42_13]
MQKFPNITRAQAKAIDAAAQRKLKIPALVLMENAGRSAAEMALAMLGPKDKKVAVFCGKGNNGGDGFACARHLATRGVGVDVYLCADSLNFKDAAENNLNILEKIGLGIIPITETNKINTINMRDYSLIVDALLGIGLRGEVEGFLKDLIYKINKSKIPVLAIDIPSGLDADSGRVLGICVTASKTLTFISKKKGMIINDGPGQCGKVIVGDIGFPATCLKYICGRNLA